MGRSVNPALGRDRHLALLSGTVIVATMVFTVWVTAINFHELQVAEEARLSAAITTILGESVSKISFSGKYQTRLLVEEIKGRLDVFDSISVEDREGGIQAHSDPDRNGMTASAEERERAAEALRRDGPVHTVQEREGRAVHEVVVPYRGGYSQEVLGVVRVGILVEASRQSEQTLLMGMILLSLSLSVVSVGAVYFVSRRLGALVSNLAWQLQEILASAPLAISIHDRAGADQGRSSEYRRLFGEPEDSLGFLPPELRDQAGRVVFEEHGHYMTQVESETADGRRRFELIQFPLSPADNTTPQACTILHDITDAHEAERALANMNRELELRVAERTTDLAKANHDLQSTLDFLNQARERLVQSEKQSGLGTIVAGVAHELNTPIGVAITLASNMSVVLGDLEKGVDQGISRSDFNSRMADLRESVVILERSLGRASDLIASFKQVAVDQGSDMRRRFDLRTAVDEIVQTLRVTVQSSWTRLEVDVDDGVQLDSYPGALGQVLINLIRNAQIHAFEGDTGGTIQIRGRREGDHAILSVRDDGKGIAPDIIGRVFDPFFTTRMGNGGTGLGLHICWNLCTGPLGGSIEVESRLGHGALFRVTIPLVAPQVKD